MDRTPSPPPARLTQLLAAWGQGDATALDQLTPLIYKELRKLAQWHMKRERLDHTLQATALLSEVYLRLAPLNRIRWQDRAHLFAVAARQMRRILIDHARKHGNEKRGGKYDKVSMTAALTVPERHADMLALDDALDALAKVDSRRSKVVEMRFFGGLSVEEIAEVLDVSPDTVKRDWKFAKAWLSRELRKRR